MVKKFEVTLAANDELEVQPAGETFALEFESAAEMTIDIIEKDGTTLYSQDSVTHAHVFFILSGNRYIVVSNTDVQSAPDLAISAFPLSVMCTQNATVKEYVRA